MSEHFDAWQRHHFPSVKQRACDRLDTRGAIDSVDGAIALVRGGVGSTVIPKHCIAHELAQKALREWRPAGSNKPLLNTIYIATLDPNSLTRRAQVVVDWFLEMQRSVGGKLRGLG